MGEFGADVFLLDRSICFVEDAAGTILRLGPIPLMISAFGAAADWVAAASLAVKPG